MMLIPSLTIYSLMIIGIGVAAFDFSNLLIVYIFFSVVSLAQIFLFSAKYINNSVNRLTFLFIFSFWAYSFFGPLEYLMGIESIMYEFYNFNSDFLFYHLICVFIGLVSIHPGFLICE